MGPRAGPGLSPDLGRDLVPISGPDPGSSPDLDSDPASRMDTVFFMETKIMITHCIGQNMAD